ncbi:hypothetical protein [Paracoccus niistensis]|uniref:Uncharacterized protein n=1 Tax=Paracoccus niistensis TaxID=632935 RepID=A0ABV6I4C2_9RHOB
MNDVPDLDGKPSDADRLARLERGLQVIMSNQDEDALLIARVEAAFPDLVALSDSHCRKVSRWGVLLQRPRALGGRALRGWLRNQRHQPPLPTVSLTHLLEALPRRPRLLSLVPGLVVLTLAVAIIATGIGAALIAHEQAEVPSRWGFLGRKSFDLVTFSLWIGGAGILVALGGAALWAFRDQPQKKLAAEMRERLATLVFGSCGALKEPSLIKAMLDVQNEKANRDAAA